MRLHRYHYNMSDCALHITSVCALFTGSPSAPSEAEYSIEENGVLIKWVLSAGAERNGDIQGYVIEGRDNGWCLLSVSLVCAFDFASVGLRGNDGNAFYEFVQILCQKHQYFTINASCNNLLFILRLEQSYCLN